MSNTLILTLALVIGTPIIILLLWWGLYPDSFLKFFAPVKRIIKEPTPNELRRDFCKDFTCDAEKGGDGCYYCYRYYLERQTISWKIRWKLKGAKDAIRQICKRNKRDI